MVRGGALALRAGTVIAATVGMAVMLAVLLAYLKFERKLIEVTTSRLAVVADDVRRRAEYGLNLGLDLAELQDLQAVVRRTAEGAEVIGLRIVNDQGGVLFSAGQAPGGKPQPWGRPDSSEAVRSRVEGDRLTVGAPVRNGFGLAVGEVIVDASLAPLRNAATEVRRILETRTGALVIGAAFLTLVTVFITIRAALDPERGRAVRNASALEPGAPEPGALALADADADALHRTVEPRMAAAVARAERDIAAVERTLIQAATAGETPR